MSPSREGNVRIMFVDNDLDYLEMVEAATQLQSDTLVAIENGAISALGKLGKLGYKVDAVITDLAMSDMDGITLTEQIRRNERIRRVPAIDVYWFTGFEFDANDPNDPITKAAEDLQVKRVFEKPYDVMKIIGEIKKSTEEKHHDTHNSQTGGQAL